jgi:hypothetical protein
VTGVAHHPYTRGGSLPPTARPHAGEITIASIGRLTHILAQASRQHRLPSGLPIYYTEFGFQTNPPNRLFGLPLALQSTYLDQSTWIAYNNPRVRSVAQYELRDERARGQFKTGLRFVDGRPKPALATYQMPIWVVRAGSGLRVFGQLRATRPRSGQLLEIQNETRPRGAFTTVRTVPVTSPQGFILVSVPLRPGSWRLRWQDPGGGGAVISRVASPGPA